MAVAIRTITRLQDADDAPSLGAGQNGYALTWNNATSAFVATALPAAGVTDHGALTGLTPDDDHTQYALLAGRAGGQTLYGGTAANQSITIHGTSDATRTTSYVLLQPTAGRVGIGTIAPVGVLEAVTQIGTDYPLWLTAYASDPVPGIVGRSARGTQATPSATQLNDFLFAFGGRGYTGSAFETNSQVLIAMKAAEIHSSTNQGTYITFGTTPIGSVSRAEVARITDTGRVGIGTTSPATALHVVGAATITAGIRPAADSTTALQLQNASGTSVLNVDTTNARVGIGTTSPGAKFQIVQQAEADVFFTETNTVSYGANWVQRRSRGTNASKTVVQSEDILGGMIAQGWDGAAWRSAGRIGLYVDGSPGSSDMPGRIEFTTTPNGSATEQIRMVIKNDGKVGINDTAPAEALDVTGNANVTGVYKVDDVQVLSNRVIDARCADVANSGDATTDGLIDALRDAMVAHGLIAAA